MVGFANGNRDVYIHAESYDDALDMLFKNEKKFYTYKFAGCIEW